MGNYPEKLNEAEHWIYFALAYHKPAQIRDQYHRHEHTTRRDCHLLDPPTQKKIDMILLYIALDFHHINVRYHHQ